MPDRIVSCDAQEAVYKFYPLRGVGIAPLVHHLEDDREYYRSHHLEDTLFDHDALYLTSFRDAADRYAVRAGYFVEIGFVAHHLSFAARSCQYTIEDSAIASKVDMIIDFAESDHHPVVVEITSYNPDLLRTERGEELHIERGRVRESMFHYLGEIDLKEYSHSQARAALSII